MSTDPTRFGNNAADAIAAPALTGEIRTKIGTERAVLVVKLPDGAGPEWAAGRRIRLTLLPGDSPPAAPPAEVAWIPLDELGDWTELAEAFGATVDTSGDWSLTSPPLSVLSRQPAHSMPPPRLCTRMTARATC